MLKKISDFESAKDVKSAFDEAAEYVADNLKKPDTGGGGTGGGSSQSAMVDLLKPDSASTLVPDSNLPTVMPQLNDISESYAKDYITELADKGIISGYGDGSFKPDNNITRAEFAKVIAVAFGISGKSDTKFADVSDEWFAGYVKTLASEDIIKGYIGYFNPGDNIKREDAIVILKRICDKFNIKNNTGANPIYSDKAQISYYAIDAVEHLSSMGIISGDGYNLNPQSHITRAEAATALGKVYKLYEKEAANKCNKRHSGRIYRFIR